MEKEWGPRVDGVNRRDPGVPEGHPSEVHVDVSVLDGIVQLLRYLSSHLSTVGFTENVKRRTLQSGKLLEEFREECHHVGPNLFVGGGQLVCV